MPLLQCIATNCTNNQNQCCCLPKILVDGRDATNATSTCCSNFVAMGCSPTNSMAPNFVTPNQNVAVDCVANDCTYNKNQYCYASTVSIAGCGASDCNETSCKTFKTKK